MPGGGCTAKFIQIEQHLTKWIGQERKDGHVVSYTDLKKEAKRVARELSLKDFRASWSWMHAYCHRNGLSYRLPTHTAQQNTKPPSQKCFDMLVHLNAMNTICAEYDPSCILNMDETPFYYDHLQKRTLDFVGNNSITTLNTGADKARFTVVVTIAASGESLPYYVILRGLRNIPSAFRQHPTPFPNVVVAVSQSGTMDETLMLDYQTRVLQPYLNGRKAALIMDAFKAHFTDVVNISLENALIRSLKLPAGYTSYGQMLDVVYNKPMKSLYKNKWQPWFTNPDNRNMTKGGNRRRPGHEVVVGWVNEIHGILASNRAMIHRSFVCCGLCHPSFPIQNGVEFASGLNSRLQELLFVRGSHFERDTSLMNIATFPFDTHSQLLSHVESYINKYISFNQSHNEPGVSRQMDTRVMEAAPRSLAFGIDNILN